MREILLVERQDEVRALAPHLTFDGLRRWFDRCLEQDEEFSASRLITGRNGRSYGVSQRVRKVHVPTTSISFTPVDAPLTRLTIYGRQRLNREGNPDRPPQEPIDLLGDYRLRWLLRVGGVLDLTVPGYQTWRSVSLPVVRVESGEPMGVTEATAMLLDVAPQDPQLQLAAPVGEK